MYKTIRHGENSLQYTILPQNDDFRIEGKLTSVSSNGSNSNKSKSKRSARKRSFFAYLGLLFVCTVIIGAILVPFLVSAECLPNPSDWFLKTRAVLSGSTSTRRLGAINTSSTVTTVGPTTISTTDTKSNKKLIESTIQSYPVDRSSIIAPQISNPKVVVALGDDKSPSIDSSTLKNDDADDKSSPTSAGSRATNDFVAEVRFESLRGQSMTPTIVVTTVKTLNDNMMEVANSTTSTMSTMTSRPMGLTATQNLTNRIMQVPLLKSASKKPIIPPVLAKTNSLERQQIEHDHQTKKDPKSPNDWIRSHWPYIDPSTYFQWTGYKTEDSVLLPAILGIALIVIIMIIALCLVARNRRSIVSSVRKRNRNDIESAGEDNTTLLTNSNLSDDD